VTNIAVAPTPTTIVFGTDGWRAKIGDDFTFENVRRCADGVARYVVERAGDEVRAVAGADATMTASETIALLRGARPFAADVDALLARCTGAHS